MTFAQEDSCPLATSILYIKSAVPKSLTEFGTVFSAVAGLKVLELSCLNQFFVIITNFGVLEIEY